ncbi:hypothetical protein D1AOALGA4SA_10090 [Olavius algarvensis Delta 1 endosymbiont]|nr:hypothetical protein D1AOALGA4SA_10090 [Olavius algarvensis Delta 1 endosymbiont]
MPPVLRFQVSGVGFQQPNLIRYNGVAHQKEFFISVLTLS